MSSAPKLCKNCKYYVHIERILSFPEQFQCNYRRQNSASSIDLVTGEEIKEHALPDNCYKMRGDIDCCGPDGKWWER